MLRFGEDNVVMDRDDYSAILVGLTTGEDISRSMEELAGLCEAAGIDVIGEAVQSLSRPNTATLIGKGKVQEIAEMVATMDADTVVFNNELTGMQMRNLEDALGVRIVDRTMLILDIFAGRATSAEGKLQVELAQLKYRLPRLMGFGKSLSRLGAGIGTRGPGEKKLETDRRHIERRIQDISNELKDIRRVRKAQRGRREKRGVPVVALVGYTNSGKSALMNRLLSMSDKEEKTVDEKDMLFATLDTQQRSVSIDSAHSFILIDTVGFVSSLPHSLVEAFKATLEEVSSADLLLYVVDSAYEGSDYQIKVTEDVIGELGAGDRDRIMVFNKMDIAEERPAGIPGAKNIYISARTGENIDALLESIKEMLFPEQVVTLLIPYDKGSITSYLCDHAEVIYIEHVAEGTRLTVPLTHEDRNRYRQYEETTGAGS